MRASGKENSIARIFFFIRLYVRGKIIFILLIFHSQNEIIF
jgi:hypothetical protein